MKDGTFVNSVAVAFSRMPNAQRLEIFDGNVEDTPLKVDYDWLTTSSFDKILFEAMMARSSWESTDFGISLSSYLSGYPGRFTKREGALKILSLNEQDNENLMSAVKNLTYFDFCLEMPGLTYPDLPQRLAEIEAIKIYLGADTNTESLEDYFLGLSILWNLEVETPNSLGSLITTHSRPKLKSFYLDMMSLHQGKLEKFTDRKPIPELTVARMCLLDGRASWLEALDLLRKISTEDTTFYAPSGAYGKSFSDKRFRITEEPSYNPTGALEGFPTAKKTEAYLRGLSGLIPALNMEDGGDNEGGE